MSSVLLFNKEGFLALIVSSSSLRHKWHLAFVAVGRSGRY